jgi:hypothetical protein
MVKAYTSVTSSLEYRNEGDKTEASGNGSKQESIFDFVEYVEEDGKDDFYGTSPIKSIQEKWPMIEEESVSELEDVTFSSDKFKDITFSSGKTFDENESATANSEEENLSIDKIKGEDSFIVTGS